MNPEKLAENFLQKKGRNKPSLHLLAQVLEAGHDYSTIRGLLNKSEELLGELANKQLKKFDYFGFTEEDLLGKNVGLECMRSSDIKKIDKRVKDQGLFRRRLTCSVLMHGIFYKRYFDMEDKPDSSNRSLDNIWRMMKFVKDLDVPETCSQTKTLKHFGGS